MANESKKFDFRGMQCPIPVFETSKAMKQIEVGEQILVLANDPAAQPDLEAWSKRTGHQLLSVNDKGDYKEFLIKRTH